jgi:hypothetical protein
MLDNRFETSYKAQAIVEVDSKEPHLDDHLAIASIRQLGTYVDGWNGPGTVAPTRSTLKDAEVFALYLFKVDTVIPPHISASGDGEINFYWKGEGFSLDLGFFGDGFYSYYADLPNGLEIIEDAAPLDQKLPPEIINFIIRTP